MRIDFTFLVPAHAGSPEQRPVKWVFVRVSHTHAKNQDRVLGGSKVIYCKQTDERTDTTEFITYRTNAVGRPN